jgi:hypothetical protein
MLTSKNSVRQAVLLLAAAAAFAIGGPQARAALPFPQMPCAKITGLEGGQLDDIYSGEARSLTAKWANNMTGSSVKWTTSITPDAGPSVDPTSMTTPGSNYMIATGLAGSVTVKAETIATPDCPSTSASRTVTVKPVKVTGLSVTPSTTMALTTRSKYKAVITPEARGYIALTWSYRAKGAANWTNSTQVGREYTACETGLGTFDVRVQGVSGGVKSEKIVTVTITARPKKNLGPWNYYDQWEVTGGKLWAIVGVTVEYPPTGVPVCMDTAAIELTLTRGPTANPEEFDLVRQTQVSFAGKMLGSTAAGNKFRYIGTRGTPYQVTEWVPGVDQFGNPVQYANKVRATFLYTLGEDDQRTPFEGHFYGEGLNLRPLFNFSQASWSVYALYKLIFRISWSFDATPPAPTLPNYKSVSPTGVSFEQWGLEGTTPQRHPDLWDQ